MPFTEATDGVRLRYEVEGSGPPLVLCHGGRPGLSSWYDRGYVAAMAGTATLVMFDARGYDQSDKPTDPLAYDFRVKVLDAVTVMNELGIEDAHLFGYSMGANTAMSAAIYAPQKFRSLVIGGGSPRGAADSELLDRTWEQGWNGSHGLPAMRERPNADHDVLRASFLSSRSFGGAMQALRTTKLPYLLFAGELDEGRVDGQRALVELTGAPFFEVPDKDHVGAINTVEAIAPRVLEFVLEVQSSRADAK